MAIIKIRNAAIDLDAAEIPNLPATKITSGTLDNARISLDAAEIPNLDTAKITTGTLADARVPNLNASKITAGTIATARLGSGTANSSTFLRGDNTFSAAGGTNTPAFEANISTRQTIANNTITKVQCNTEIFDTNGNYDNSSNYRFTPTTAGKYFVYANIGMGSGDNSAFGVGSIYIYKNGSSYFEGRIDNSSNSPNQMFKQINATISMNGSADFIEIFGKIASSSGTPYFEGNNNYNLGSNFGAYKIIE